MVKYKISITPPDMDLESYIVESNLLFVTAIETFGCIGALGFEVIENVMHIRYIHVEEQLRSKGIGTQLVKKAGDYAKEKKLAGIIWTVIVEQERKARTSRFFIRNGFHIPASEECTVTIHLESLQDSYIAKLPVHISELEHHLYRMDKLPLTLKMDYERNIKPNVMEACRIEAVRGTLIPELSFALERNGQISSYVLFSILQGGLYLNAVYVNNKNATELIKLLKYCLEIVKKDFRQYGTLKVTLINQEGYHLFETLIKGANEKQEIVLVTFKTL